MKVCEMIERLKQMPQLSEVMVHVHVEKFGIKFDLTQPLEQIYQGNNSSHYDSDKHTLLIITPEEEKDRP